MNDLALRPLRGLSLCAGVGGLDLGLHIALDSRYRCVCYVEREAYCASVLVARMEDKTLDTAPIWSDVTTFDGKPWRGVVDIITSGDPCQPFSVAGKRLGEADERYIWDDVARIIREVSPPFVFLENVAGAIAFRWECRANLRELGYNVEAGFFSAAEVSAPHQRKRLFLLAEKSECIGLGEATGLDDSYSGSMRDDCTDIGSSIGEEHSSTSSIGELAESTSTGRSEGSEQRGDGFISTPAGRGFCPESEQLAHSAIGGVEGLWSAGDHKSPTQVGSPLSGRDSYGIFPPGPGETDRWKDLIGAGAPQPAVHRMDDGMAPWADRLRACGNGVVPLTAALAFVTLWYRLGT